MFQKFLAICHNDWAKWRWKDKASIWFVNIEFSGQICHDIFLINQLRNMHVLHLTVSGNLCQ